MGGEDGPACVSFACTVSVLGMRRAIEGRGGTYCATWQRWLELGLVEDGWPGLASRRGGNLQAQKTGGFRNDMHPTAAAPTTRPTGRRGPSGAEQPQGNRATCLNPTPGCPARMWGLARQGGRPSVPLPLLACSSRCPVGFPVSSGQAVGHRPVGSHMLKMHVPCCDATS